MGQLTQATIAAWQERCSIKEATGGRAELLRQISGQAFELIKVIDLERSGIRDDDNLWHRSDPMRGTAREIAELCNRWCGLEFDFDDRA